MPKHSAEKISTVRNKKLKKQVPKKGEVLKEKPGTESLRKDRAVVTKYGTTHSIVMRTISSRYEISLMSLFSFSLDKMHQMLTELCTSYSMGADFTVFKHILVPAEFLLSQLEMRLTKYCTFLYTIIIKVHLYCSYIYSQPNNPVTISNPIDFTDLL